VWVQTENTHAVLKLRKRRGVVVVVVVVVLAVVAVFVNVVVVCGGGGVDDDGVGDIGGVGRGVRGTVIEDKRNNELSRQ
jgi:hypothetical protein